MAGNYPDLPAPRIEYDRDGTRVYHISTAGVVTEQTSVAIARGNNESESDSIWSDITTSIPWILWVFPQLMDITHLYIDNGFAANTATVEWSVDSTTGTDGTWTLATSTWSVPGGDTQPAGYRNNIQPISGLLGVKMVRLKMNGNYPYYTTIHFYGKPSAGQTLHRLRLWHPTLDEPLDNYPAHLDWGNAEQGSSGTRTFRVKNDSLSLSASGITVFMQSLTDSAPTQVSQHELSTDGTTWQIASSELTIPNLAPQAISGVLHLRRTTPLTAQLGIWRQRLVASADTWA